MEDLNDGMEWVFRNYGRYLNQVNEALPPRNDVMEFDVQTNTKDLDRNLKLQCCLSDLQDKVKEVVTEYWDVFCGDGLRRPVWGFSFQIYTGNHPLICCKSPMYGPCESDVMLKLVKNLDENGVVEEDDRPCSAFVVLAAKLHQENVPWHKYQWRLCLSYRKLDLDRPNTWGDLRMLIEIF